MDINIINFYRRKDGFNEVFKRMKKHENERKQVLIVPEKFGVSAEKALFEYIGGASFFIDVTTFDRMADKYVVDKNIQYLSKSAGVMLVQKIAQDNMDNLQVLSHSCTYNGFCENVFNTIMLLKSSQVSPDKLKQAVENLQDISRMKLEDIQKLYNIYEETLSNRFIDSANKMDKLGQELAYDDDIREIDFYVYSPKLTKQVLNVLSTLAKNAHSLTFMLDAYNENSSVYDANYLQITSLIKSLGAKYNESTVQRFDSLSVMLKAVGSNQRNSNNNIKFYSFKTQQEEITALCQDIVRQGDRYYDSAVLVCNLEKYQSTLEKIFSSFNIAYFMDTQQTLLDLTPTRTLLQLINLLYEFKVDKVLNIVKSKIFEYDDDKIQNFELYLKRWGINERNFFGENKPEDDLLLDFMSIYEDFVSKFKEFKNKMSVCNTYGEIIEVLREYIDKWHIAEYIQSECKRLNEIGQNQKSKLYEQIVKKWNTLFDQLENILGLNTVSVKDFYIVLKAGLNTVMVKTPPLNIDCVYIGEAGNAMLYDYKNIYVIGAVEGAFPVYNQDCGLIVDKELDQMREIAPIDPTIREVNVENICNNINNIVCTDNLWLSYPVSLFFVEQRPSTFLNLLRKAFVDKSGQPIDFSGFIAYDIMDEPEQFAESIVTQSRAKTYVLSMKEQIYKPKSVQARLNGIADYLGLRNKSVEELIIPRNVQSGSVSQVQEYFECPYRNFVKYGLRLKENPDNTLKPIDVGNFLHKVAELFGLYLIKSKLNYVKDEKVFNKICDSALEYFSYDEKGNRGKVLDTKQKAIINNLINSAILMLCAINEQNKLSEFKITSVEKNINLEISENNIKFNLKGKVDRIDTFGDYFRIIDYKTGSEVFKETDLRCGRRIQLFVYMSAIQKLEKLNPTAGYYFKIKDDFTSPYSDKDYLRTYCLNGVTVDDKELILAQDTSLSVDNPSSDIVPVKCIFKDDDFKLDGRRAGAYPREVVQEFIDYAMSIFKQGLFEISVGNIAKSPYNNACDYCDYKGALCMSANVCRRIKEKKGKK